MTARDRAALAGAAVAVNAHAMSLLTDPWNVPPEAVALWLEADALRAEADALYRR